MHDDCSFTDMPDLWIQIFELLTKLELLVHEEIVFINIVSVAFHLLYYITVCFLGEFDVLFFPLRKFYLFILKKKKNVET